MDNNNRNDRGNEATYHDSAFLNSQPQMMNVNSSGATNTSSGVGAMPPSNNNQFPSSTTGQYMTPNEILTLARGLSGLGSVGLGGGSSGPTASSTAELLQKLGELQKQQQQQTHSQQVSMKNPVSTSNMDRYGGDHGYNAAAGAHRMDSDSNSSGKDPDSSGQMTEATLDGPQGAQLIEPSAQPISSLSSNTNSNSDSSEVVFLPCRARGMPVDHNFRSAHFRIPPNVKHGEHLVCSYPECRREGVKFRFCLTCQIPVASRNFRQRHSHYNSEDKKKGQGIKEKSSEKNKKKSKSSNKISAEPKKPPVAQITKKSESKPKASSSGLARMSRERSSSSSRCAEPRELRWSSLLGRRPDSNDADGMSFWLSEVMAISDPKIPVETPLSSSLTGSLSEYSTDSRDETSSVTSSDFSVKIADSDDCDDDFGNPRRYDPKAKKRMEEERLRRKRKREEEEQKFKEQRNAYLERKESSKKRHEIKKGPLKKRHRSSQHDKVRPIIDIDTSKDVMK